MKVAVLRETRSNERRVALIPSAIAPLTKAGIDVAVESGAGKSASFSDEEYRAAGATVHPDPLSTLQGASALLKVSPPVRRDGLDEISMIPDGCILIGFLWPLTDTTLAGALAQAGVTSFAMDQVPRTTRAQKMDALSSQATVAGYKAVLMAANHLGKFLPMFMTAAGTIRPAKALVLGAGVAGLQAIATARRLGAVVEAFDVRPAVKEQVESLGAKFLEAELDESSEDEGGYAKALSEEQHDKELELIAAHIHEADVVITTAQIPGRDAPLLITEEMVRSMPSGAVIIDLAAESGGNCALTRAGETVEHDGVSIIGPSNLPSTLPVHASQMYAKNISDFLLHMVEEGGLKLDFDDEIVSGSCVTHKGEVVHARTRSIMGLGDRPAVEADTSSETSTDASTSASGEAPEAPAEEASPNEPNGSGSAAGASDDGGSTDG